MGPKSSLERFQLEKKDKGFTGKAAQRGNMLHGGAVEHPSSGVFKAVLDREMMTVLL